MKKYFYSLLVLALPFQVSADEYLRIGDVQNSWSTYEGSIDKAVIFVTPKGMYAECKVYLDFSVTCTPFTNPADSLEIQMGFRLPVEAEVTDLWLWVGGIPVQAGIYDRWTASQIYETIVNRREDPALLVKQSGTDYELHIFPLMVNLPRKIEMTFLLPLSKLVGSESQVSLPLSILKLSECPIDTMIFAVKPEGNLDNPLFLELPQQSFQWVNDAQFGECYITNLATISGLSSLTLSFSSTNQQNYFAGYYESDVDQGTYQLELDIAGLFEIQPRKKTLFLIDFVNSNSSLSSAHVLQNLKNYVTSWFEAGDSVNFMFSGLFTHSVSGEWISADPASLATAFNSTDTTLMNNSTNLPVLLLDGINFIQTQGGEGNIVLLASSDEFTNTEDANGLFDDVIAFMGNEIIGINTINLDDYSYLNYLGNNLYYRGNEYLYLNLSLYTGAEFQTILEYESVDNYYWYFLTVYNSYESMLGYLFPMLTDYFTAVDVYATVDNGFTYSGYSINSSPGFVYYGSPYRLTGKYYGDFPLEISVSALTSDGDLYYENITIDDSQLHLLDSTAEDIWAGQYLRSLLALPQTNMVVFETINASKDARVLCEYTAFLALEPEADTISTLSIPIVVSGGGFPVGIDENFQSALLKCYPNPANSVVWFQFENDIEVNTRIEIYNIHGEKVASIVNEVDYVGRQVLEFDVSNLPAGVYFYHVKNEKSKIATGKLIVCR